MEDDKKFCKHCGEKIDKDTIVCPKCGRQLKLVKKEETDSSDNKEDKNNTNETKFYKATWFMWVMLIFFAPLGIFLMWKFHNEMQKTSKIILSIFFGIVFLVALVGSSGDGTNENSTKKTDSNKATETTTKTEKNEYLDALRKCTVMEASDIYTTGIGQKSDNVFNDAKKICDASYQDWGEKEFIKISNADWKERKNEKIDGKTLEYYLSILNW